VGSRPSDGAEQQGEVKTGIIFVEEGGAGLHWRDDGGMVRPTLRPNCLTRAGSSAPGLFVLEYRQGTGNIGGSHNRKETLREGGENLRRGTYLIS